MLSLNSAAADALLTGSAAIINAVRLHPLVYGRISCPSLRGGCHPDGSLVPGASAAELEALALTELLDVCVLDLSGRANPSFKGFKVAGWLIGAESILCCLGGGMHLRTRA